MNGESSMDAYMPTYVNRQPMGICCMTQGNTNQGSVLQAHNLDGVGVDKRWQGDS